MPKCGSSENSGLISSPQKIMDIAVSSKTSRRQGVTKEHGQNGPVTEEQRSRRAVFGETPWAGALLARVFVALRSQIAADMLARHVLPRVKIPFSSNIQNFLTGCQA
jgi:hypothetical protein